MFHVHRKPRWLKWLYMTSAASVRLLPFKQVEPSMQDYLKSRVREDTSTGTSGTYFVPQAKLPEKVNLATLAEAGLCNVYSTRRCCPSRPVCRYKRRGASPVRWRSSGWPPLLLRCVQLSETTFRIRRTCGQATCLIGTPIFF